MSKPKKILYPTGKPDWDNIGKLVCDSLNGILWRDDAVIVDGSTSKRYCDQDHPQPGYRITVTLAGSSEVR
jgi:Holliday junction resolvase RusA-like endonuclease